ncbi:MAG: hypothetical protein MZW92_39975 [Comamonadaceae bacterium]|nr:hypothetical protein [Comamonadaceae bacterium]
MNRTTTAILALVVICSAGTTGVRAQEQPALEISAYPSTGQVEFDLKNNTFVATNGVMVRYGNAILTADRARGDQASGEIVAEGRVRDPARRTGVGGREHPLQFPDAKDGV